MKYLAIVLVLLIGAPALAINDYEAFLIKCIAFGYDPYVCKSFAENKGLKVKISTLCENRCQAEGGVTYGQCEKKCKNNNPG